MPIKEFNTPYPVIDTDPHFGRVVRYMRPTDYAAWAAGTAAAPALLLGMGKIRNQNVKYYARNLMDNFIIEKMDPVGPMRNLRIPLRIATVVGAFGGFLYAYQTSSRKSLKKVSFYMRIDN